MTGMGDHRTGLHVSSWGWADEEGRPCKRSEATFRLWSLCKHDRRFAMLLFHPDRPVLDVFIAASALLRLEEE